MKICEALTRTEPIFSFEFFPAKDADGMMRLFETISKLRRYQPTYVSVTYGAGGSTRRLTVDLVRHIKADTGIETMAHLTCVGATVEEIDDVLAQLAAGGIENVLALRGDPPKGEPLFRATKGGFAYASDLAAHIRATRPEFCIAGACYPETHTEAPDPQADLYALKRKVENGVQLLITQLFFDNADYFSFVERARAQGITVPIVPGIMPITNAGQVQRFTAMCGARIPVGLLERLDRSNEDAEAVRKIGIEWATAQCRDLLSRGAPGIHFYTLNRSPATVQVLEALRA